MSKSRSRTGLRSSVASSVSSPKLLWTCVADSRNARRGTEGIGRYEISAESADSLRTDLWSQKNLDMLFFPLGKDANSFGYVC